MSDTRKINVIMQNIPDVQNSPDNRQIVINKVGIKDLRHPLQIKTRDGVQSTVATATMSVRLPEHVKGTHMSRFLQILNDQSEPLSLSNFPEMLQNTVERLGSEHAYIDLSFPFFIKKQAPVSKIDSLLDYEVTLSGSIENGQVNTRVHMVIPITSLCPCSKKISEYGAHNQRSHVTLDVDVTADIEIEEIIQLVEEQASCELFGLLKRSDEKYVTEKAYDNPKFVEDLVRDIAGQLNKEERILSYTLECENFESIHNHSAYAIIES